MIEPLHENILGKLPPQIQNILTPNVIQKATELAEMAPVKFPIFELTAYDDKLLVIHDFSWRDGKASADIFASDGAWIGEFSHDHYGLFSGFIVRMIFKNGYAYCIETKEEDNFLVRYKVELTPAG